MMGSYGIFLRKFLSAPSKIGSVMPSSKYLTAKMFATVDWDTTTAIAELGAGTGVFTELIAQKKHLDAKAVIIEQDPVMRENLIHRFPSLCFGSQAENLPFILRKLGLEKVDCIISGLPFAVFDKSLREKILQAAYDSLREGGTFIAFQYSPQMYLAFKRRFANVQLGFEARNLPPAIVYRCTK